MRTPFLAICAALLLVLTGCESYARRIASQSFQVTVDGVTKTGSIGTTLVFRDPRDGGLNKVKIVPVAPTPTPNPSPDPFPVNGNSGASTLSQARANIGGK